MPNLLFTRDSSVWIRDRVAITSLASWTATCGFDWSSWKMNLSGLPPMPPEG